MDNTIKIKSDHIVDNIDDHFKVCAGAGAGKTHWLVNHIKNVSQNSSRLGRNRKIACITYTNVAADTILERIGFNAERVEVSTIHSFLYKNIVKPYMAFLSPEHGLDISLVDGHDDTILSGYNFIREWKSKTKQNRIKDEENHLVVSALKSARWTFESGELVLKTSYPIKIGNYPITRASYLEYKKMAWSKGVIHHDDVLFFSYQLIKTNPFIIEILSAKYPYFFIDEFQDTSPIQIEIINKLASEKTVIGVIGDEAQSIYGFLGSQENQLHDFTLPNMNKYSMHENRRSSQEIVDFLNKIRPDFQQNCAHQNNTENPILMVSTMNNALLKISADYSEDFCFLSRINNAVNSLRVNLDMDYPKTNLIETLYANDSNSVRRKIVRYLIEAIELARCGCFKQAIKNIDKIGLGILKSENLYFFCSLLEKYNSFQDRELHFFYQEILAHFGGAKLSKGKPMDFYQQYSYKQIASCISIKDDAGKFRTIHRSKGDEFDNVFVHLEPEDSTNLIKLLKKPELGTSEDYRVLYVAFSRAKRRLVINIPSLSLEDRNAISHYNLQIIEI